jgi:DNA-binding winged helix-turn-helix (wHTH) protein
MPQHEPSSRLVRFASFELDLKTGELHQDGVRVRLQEQPFQVLSLLVERAGDLVTRDELRTRLWPGSVFVDFDHGLNKAIAKLRQAIGDMAERPVFVETLERRGYRFLAPVVEVDPSAVRHSTNPPADRVTGGMRLTWSGRAISLLSGSNLIGRDVAALVWIDSSDVSRRHAQVTVGADAAVIEDLNSKNGTFLNGQRLGAPTTLSDGDTIRIGPASLAFRSAAVPGPTLTSAE